MQELYGGKLKAQSEKNCLRNLTNPLAHPDEKSCTKCNIMKPIWQFGTSRNVKSGFKAQCKECRGKYFRGRSGKTRDREIKKAYGLTPAQVEDMVRAQDRRCAICRVEFEKIKRFVVDHDHKTGKVRGLLCDLCNHRIVPLENPEFLEAAMRYLKEHS